MLRLIGWFIKLTLFSIFVLVVGNWVHWNGRTISDQVRIQLSHAERASGRMVRDAANWHPKKWAKGIAQEAQSVSQSLSQPLSRGLSEPLRSPSIQKAAAANSDQDAEIPSSERQKLRALIRDLNRTQTQNP